MGQGNWIRGKWGDWAQRLRNVRRKSSRGTGKVPSYSCSKLLCAKFGWIILIRIFLKLSINGKNKVSS